MADTVHTLRDHHLNPLLQATVEATEEAIVNALCAADTMTGRDNNTIPGLPLDRLVDILKQYNRIE